MEVSRLAERSQAQAMALDLSRSDPDVLSLRSLERPEWARRERGDAQRARQLVAEPTVHLRRTLGEVPADRDLRQQWGRDALAAERYRTHHRLDPIQMTSKLTKRVTHVARALTSAQRFISQDIEHERQREIERNRNSGYGREMDGP